MPYVSTQPLPCNISADKARSDTDVNYPTDATTGPADAMSTTSSNTPDCNVSKRTTKHRQHVSCSLYDSEPSNHDMDDFCCFVLTKYYAIMNLQARLNSILSCVSTTVTDIQDSKPPNHDMDDFDLVSQLLLTAWIYSIGVSQRI